MSRCAAIEDTWKIRFRTNGKIKTALVTAKDHKRAENLARSYPNVISVAKADNDYYRIANSEMTIFTNKVLANNKPVVTAIALDELVFKRVKRIENRDKDKVDK